MNPRYSWDWDVVFICLTVSIATPTTIIKLVPPIWTDAGKLVINDIYERFENIYKGYSIEKIYNNYTYKGEGIQDIDKQFFMYPYAGIRIEFTLTTRELCQRYIL